jgi:ubiquinone/menaquinone biosynthesis C-methylase UbiE
MKSKSVKKSKTENSSKIIAKKMESKSKDSEPISFLLKKSMIKNKNSSQSNSEKKIRPAHNPRKRSINKSVDVYGELASLKIQLTALHHEISNFDSRHSARLTINSPETRISPTVVTAIPTYELRETKINDEGDEFYTSLLDQARLQYLMGDWISLSKINIEQIQNNPSRGKLALLASVGRMQMNKHEEAKQLMRLAQDWGVSKKLIYEIAISCVHNCIKTIRLKYQNLNSSDVDGTLALLNNDTLTGERGVGSDKSFIQGYSYKDSSDNEIQMSSDQVHDYWRRSEQDPLEYANVNNKRSMRLTEIIQEYIKKGSILELGTNCGRNLHHLYKAGFNDLEGVEISPAAILTLRDIYPELKHIRIHNGTIEDLIPTFPDKSFECVFSMAVLEHIHYDSDWVFAHIARIAHKIITIEDELRIGERHFSRNYEKVFTRFGMRQIHMEDRKKWELPHGFTARVFTTN